MESAMTNETNCDLCNAPINPARYEIGYTTCKPCGEKVALKVRHAILAPHKQGYMAYSPEAAREVLLHLNKRANT